MRFKEKASSIALAAILLTSSIIPANALMKQEIIGSNRYETAGKVADRMGNYSSVILVNGDSIADGLAASGLAGKENAPILLVKKDSIPKETLQRLYKVKKVYIIGKEGAISSRVEKSLNNSGINTKRIGGNDRIGTSLEVSREIGSYSKAFLVNGMKGEADAMSVASIAARDKAPIILTNGKDKPTYKKSGVKYYVVGGNTVMSDSLQNSFSAERLSGSNRYTTNKVIVKKFYPNTDKLYFAKGDNLVDALSVSPLAKNNGLALVSDNSDKSVFYGKDGIIQVGGMNQSIVDKVFKATFEDSAKPDEQQKPGEGSAKPDENKPENPQPGPTPIPPEDNKPNEDNKPVEKTYDINSAEFQKIVRDEFYRLLDAHRADNGKERIQHSWAFEQSAMLKSKHMIDNDYYSHSGTFYDPYTLGGAENIHWIYVRGDLTGTKAKSIANELFTGWKNSPGHNEIMLMDSIDTASLYDVDGFAFCAKWNASKNRYDLKATYYNSFNDRILKNEPSVELTSIPEVNIKSVTEIFK